MRYTSLNMVPQGNSRNFDVCVYVVGIIFATCGLATSKVFYNVTCGSRTMQVTLNLTDHPASIVYLQNLKGYPGCEPSITQNMVLFRLSLNDSGVSCGVSKMLNKQTGHRVYYHRVVIESQKQEKELLFVQCVIPGDFNMEFVLQDWMRESVPYNFTIPTTTPISFVQEKVPYVNMAVRNKGQRLDTSAIVHPGSLLELLIYLDKESSAYFDITLRYLTLADPTHTQEEIVVMNGCSVDPFVLDIFPPTAGVLKSQFRAFKFQSSDFVIFLATVSVCLQQCMEVDCYGDADQSGRRKREIPKFLPHYTNEMYEVELTAFLRIKSHVEGDIIIEENTNDTLDMYDTEYSNDFGEFVSSSLTTSSQSGLKNCFSEIIFLICVAISMLQNFQS